MKRVRNLECLLRSFTFHSIFCGPPPFRLLFCPSSFCAMSQRPSTDSATGLNPPTSSGPDRTPSPAPSTASRSRGEDYVYFERSTDGFSPDAVSRATAAKLKLESYYKLAVDVAIERNGRYVRVDRPDSFHRLTDHTGESSWNKKSTRA